MTRTLSLLTLAIGLSFAIPLSAQVPTGTPTYGSFAGGPDVVDLANLNAHIDVPVFSKAGRGMPFSYDLINDSSVWYPVVSSGSHSWQLVANWNWAGQTQVATGYVTYLWQQGSCNIGTRTDPSIAYYDIYYFLYYYDKWGRAHQIMTKVDDDGDTCPNDPYGPTATVALWDGSGYQIYLSAYAGPSATVYPAGGGSYSPPLQTGTGYGNAVDRNGNEITVSGGVFTDTLGTIALTVAGSGTPSSPLTFTYAAPSGANAAYTMKYTGYTVQTKFNCSGIGEYGPTSNNLVSEIDLPDIAVNASDKYTFTYEYTPGDTHTPHYVTGRIASVTLPSGGTITYAYSGGGSGVNGISCADGSGATITRTTPDGTWTYAQVKGTGTASTTTVTDPQGNQTVIQFQGIYETQRQVYQGTTSGTLLKTVNTCYNASSSPCTGTAITPPIAQRNIIAQLPGTSNLESEHIYKYNYYGALTEQDDYDYGPGSPGALLKKTAITYASLGPTITALRSQVTVTNGAGTTISQTGYNYDQTAVTTTSGTPQHTSVSGSRGNLTSINYYTQGSTFLTKTMTYFDTGKVQTVTDLNGVQTTYNYPNATSTCGNAFPTSANEPLSLSRSMTWNCTGGVRLTITDENSQTTTTAYTDPYFWRPASTTDPTSAVANYTYVNPTQVESVLSFNSGNSATDALLTLDPLGRNRLGQTRQAPGSTNFDTVETDYDSLGRPDKTTLAFATTAGTTNSSAPGTTKTFDALSRVTGVTDSGSGTLSKTYSQNDVLVTRGPAPSGENTKRRQLEYDGLGRLTSVCEVTSGTTAWPGGACAQNTSLTGYWTKYSNDALGHLTAVTQNAQTSSTQSRSYSYDLMGRLLSETNPESGTTTYTFDADSTCGTYDGDLVKRVDAVGNVTCYSYDALHRPLTVTYPSGSYSSVTPQKHFVYDSATVNSIAMTYAKSRIAEAYTCFSPCTTKLTDVGFSYTVRGQPSDVYESTPNSGTYYHVNEQYWANGAISQLSGLSALPTFTFAPDGEGRLYQASVSSGQNPVTSTVFNSASLPTAITYGSSDTDAYSYDPNTYRVTQYQFTVNSQSLTGALTWNANHTLSALNITDALYSADTQSCSYSHDDLTRLVSANCGSVWSQTFGYDPFGNLNSSGSMSFQPTYSASTNRMTAVGSFTPTYDANGNTTADPANTYSWDSAGRPVSLDGVNLTYDALGRMVEQNRAGTYTQIVYEPHGSKFALMSGTALQKAFLPLPGGGQAVYNSSGLLYYGHLDHLGSIRVGSSSTRTVVFDMAYAPFGETYATSGSTDPAFTTQRQDTVPNVYDFPAREYNNFGRWPSPDPSGLAAVHPRDPQTLNRYAYVRGNPLAITDPQGLDDSIGDDNGSEAPSDGGCSDIVRRGGSSHGHAHANDCGDGGDTDNSGGDCDADSANCGGNNTTTQNSDNNGDNDCDADNDNCGDPDPSDPNANQNQTPSWCPPGDGCDTSSNPSSSQQQTQPMSTCDTMEKGGAVVAGAAQLVKWGAGVSIFLSGGTDTPVAVATYEGADLVQDVALVIVAAGAACNLITNGRLW
jgi:RHS repeat-associated protein